MHYYVKYFFLLNYSAAAKSLQLCPTLCNPTDGSPPGSSVHRILQARILGWAAIESPLIFIFTFYSRSYLASTVAWKY